MLEVAAAVIERADGAFLRSLALPLEYGITDAENLGGEMLMRIERRLASGLRLIQVRDKALPHRPDFARSVVAMARRYGAKVLVNGDEQAARAAGADGVQ